MLSEKEFVSHLRNHSQWINISSPGDVEEYWVTADKDKKTVIVVESFDPKKKTIEYTIHYPGSDNEKTHKATYEEFRNSYKPKPPVGIEKTGKVIKVKVKYDFKHEHLKKLLPLGFETELHLWGNDSVKVYPANYQYREVVKEVDGKKITELVRVGNAATYLPKGYQAGASFIAVDGTDCGWSMIEHALGSKPYGDIFDKI